MQMESNFPKVGERVKSIKAPSPPVGMMWKFGEDCQLSLYSKATFTPRLSASSVECLANERLHLARDEVSDWLDAQSSTLTALV
ncbi:hypothetical protein TNCV_1701931 [Trichonephila clavipes]|nr:hypothetical protein TNCV_1701931 [Trichonephila clavipes]